MNPPHVVSKFLQKVHTKQLETLQRQTQQLDQERRDYLRTVLRSGNSNSTCADALGNRSSSTNSSVVVGEEDLEEQTMTTTTQKEEEEKETPQPEDTRMVDALQREIETAVEQQQDLAARRSFLQTRLAVYERKLRGLEHQSGGGHKHNNNTTKTTTTTTTKTTSQLPTMTKNTPPTEEQEHLLCHTTPRRHRRCPRGPNSDDDDEEEEEDKSKCMDDVGVEEEEDDDENLNTMPLQLQTQLASYRRALLPIHEMITTMETEWHTNQRKLEAMQVRHWDLQVKTEECQIVRNELYNNNKYDNYNNDNIHYNTTANHKIHDTAFYDENPTRATATATTTRASSSTTYTDTKFGDRSCGNNSIEAEYTTNNVVFSDNDFV